jgi:rSAM/selenodomain-associated transferase 1
MGTDLGSALHGAFEQAFTDGAQRVLIISTDSPDMPASFLNDAYMALHDHDLVLGPSKDGGYYLIGLTRPQVRLFEHITWSTDVVYAQTLERAAEAALRVYALPLWYDIDTFAELRLLTRNLDRLPVTRAALSAIPLDLFEAQEQA